MYILPGMRSPCFCGFPTPALENLGLRNVTLTLALKKPRLQLQAQNPTLSLGLTVCHTDCVSKNDWREILNASKANDTRSRNQCHKFEARFWSV